MKNETFLPEDLEQVLARARATRVFPVPGGPKNRTPEESNCNKTANRYEKRRKETNLGAG
jgi:hypothetical protein